MRAALEELAPGRVSLSRSDTAATSYSVVVQPPTATAASGTTPAPTTSSTAPATWWGVARALRVPDPRARHDGGPRGPTVALFERAHAQGSATSLDLSFCADNSPLRGYDWEGYLAAVLPHTDVFCPSWDDLTSARGEASPPEPGRSTRRRGACWRWEPGWSSSRWVRRVPSRDLGADGVHRLAGALGVDPSLWADRTARIPAAP
ncbi:hypothetical protein G7085_07820 [Tessaracoccus sp. HDW20]|uniref:hypothetical protein n=1 Tax=Tessaracoccus coleopterorum TaxID=2714950 RepID=UPI0018D43B31|nr:hypothetical protein [Tessaracoccus coleopterorum]NHB84551.1 hypothetical protein [Tessaracoccus coleopterorum]